MGGEAVDFDLKANEVSALDAVLRESAFDPSVHVIEVATRLNVINIGKLAELSASLPDDAVGCLVTLKDGTHLVDREAILEWFLWEFRRSPEHWLPIAFGPNAERFQQWNPPIPVTVSEETGTVTILGRRPGNGVNLIAHLSSESVAVRLAAAQALGARLAESGVMEALMKATDDGEPAIRAAAVASLGAHTTVLPASFRLNDSADTACVLKAMSDRDADVRISAARAAVEFPCAAVEAALFAMLDDEDTNVRCEACRSLGARKSNGASTRLRQLRTDTNRRIKEAAIDALLQIGELSQIDAAIAKIAGNIADREDFDVIIEAKASEAVPTLLAALERGNSYLAAEALGELGAREAIQPIIDQMLTYEHVSGPGVFVEALGKVGDERAVGPIRTILKLQQPQDPSCASSFVALARLKQPDAVELATAFFGQSPRLDGQRYAIGTLGQSKLTEFVPLLETFLDQEPTCRAAAAALRDNRSSQARKALAGRLEDDDYRYGIQILNELAKDRVWLATSEATDLFDCAAKSPNKETRATARKLSQARGPNGRP